MLNHHRHACQSRDITSVDLFVSPFPCRMNVRRNAGQVPAGRRRSFLEDPCLSNNLFDLQLPLRRRSVVQMVTSILRRGRRVRYLCRPCHVLGIFV
jgi:hypothetical protein